jgi:hypothetical protein
MPRSNGKHLLIANSYTLHLISLRFGDSAYPPPEPSAKPARTEEEPRRWRAYLTVGEEDEPEKVIVYCPDCAKRKFDQTIADRRRVRYEHRPLPLSPRCDPQRSDFSACRADGIREEFAVVWWAGRYSRPVLRVWRGAAFEACRYYMPPGWAGRRAVVRATESFVCAARA